MISPVQIREVSRDDRDAIIELDHDAGLDPARAHLVDRLLQAATGLVAEQGGGIVGYAALEYSFFENGFISFLYIAEPERRRGIGRALLEGLRERCTTRKLFTSTNQSNEPMQALLESLGFQQSGVIENLDPGDPELFYFFDRGE